jgi:ABC-2 type transport system permease protein
MPGWAQALGEALPLTHFMRIVRGIALKGNGFADMRIDVLALVVFMLVAMGLALFRFRRTLD